VGSKKHTPSSKTTRVHAAVNVTQSSQAPIITPSFVNEEKAKEEVKLQPPASASPSRVQVKARRAFDEPKAAPAPSPVPSFTPPAPSQPRHDPSIKARAISSSFKDSGNKFFNQALYIEAETAYSHAIGALESANELDGVEMAVLHSNRAGARIMIGKPVSALEDAKKAVSMDPTFIRAAIRVITCHMKLGECSTAHALVQDVLSKLGESQPCYHDAVRKAKEVDDSIKDLARIKSEVNADGLSRERLNEILVSAQPLEHFIAYSEELAAIRFRILLHMGRFHDALKALEVSHDGKEDVRNHPWRHWALALVKYHSGDLHGSVTSCSSLLLLIDKTSAHDQERCGLEGARSLVGLPTADSVRGLVKHMKALLELKDAGNAAIKSGSFQAAISKYTEAIGLGASAAYSAVLHSNRAAAHQGLGSLMEAVADCGRSRALDPSFLKAHTRMASLLQELRRPESAEALLSDLLLSTSDKLLTNTVKMNGNESSEVASQIQNLKTLGRWQKTPDHYKALSLDRSCTDEDVRRAYRKAALKFHPDKALSACRYGLDLPSHILAASDPRNHKVVGSQEIESRLREEASILFNVINQANEELSDQSRRRKVDMLLSSEAPPPSYRPSSSPYDYGMNNGGEGRSSYQSQGAYRYTSGYAGRR
jgi:DnaJ family protein C protein 7